MFNMKDYPLLLLFKNFIILEEKIKMIYLSEYFNNFYKFKIYINCIDICFCIETTSLL